MEYAKIMLTDKQIEKTLIKFIKECDADELCDIVSKLFGGYLEYDYGKDGYIFIPDENYCGTFDHYKEK